MVQNSQMHVVSFHKLFPTKINSSDSSTLTSSKSIRFSFQIYQSTSYSIMLPQTQCRCIYLHQQKGKTNNWGKSKQQSRCRTLCLMETSGWRTKSFHFTYVHFMLRLQVYRHPLILVSFHYLYSAKEGKTSRLFSKLLFNVWLPVIPSESSDFR